MFDHLGSRGIPGYKDFVKKLEATDPAWTPMLPIHPLKGELRRPDLRNHRKIMVVDGRVAFTGSQNLIEAGYDKPKNHELGREWVELMTRLEGPVVRQLNVVFATDWFTETGEDLTATMTPQAIEGPARPDAVEDVGCQVVPSGPGFATENNLRLFNSMIYAARDRLSLTSPYFVPDESLLYAVTTAAQRGVDVELFVSATADQFMVAPRPALLLRGAARGRGPDLALPRSRSSCTPSTSASTTGSAWSARATWTCGRSRSTTRSS